MMTKQMILPIIFLWYAFISSLCESADLTHLTWKSKEEPKKCYVESCGPPFSVQFVPNPLRVDTECSILIDFEVAHDLFKGYFRYYLKGPGTFHLTGTLDVVPDHPYLQGEHLYQNYTFHLPPYIAAGVPFYGNFTLNNDTDQQLICGTCWCEFAPKDIPEEP